MTNDILNPVLLRTKIVHEARHLIEEGRVVPCPGPYVVTTSGTTITAGGINVLHIAASRLLSHNGELGLNYIDTPEFRKVLGGKDRLPPWLRLSNAMGLHWVDTLIFDSLCMGGPTRYGTRPQQQAAWMEAHNLPERCLPIKEKHLTLLDTFEKYDRLRKHPDGSVNWRAALPEGDAGTDEGRLRTQEHPTGAVRAAPVEQPGVGPLPHLATHPGPGTGGSGTPGLPPADHVLGHRRVDEDQGGGALLVRYPRPHPLPAVHGGREGADLLREGPDASPRLRVVGPLQRWGGPPEEDRAEDPLEAAVRAVRSPGITQRRQGSSLSLLAPGLSSGSMSKVRIEIEDDGRVLVYVGEQLVPALVNVDFAHVREGYKAAVLVVGKGDPRAEATIDALLEANGTRVVNPLYIEEDEYKGLQMDNLRKRMTKEMKEEADREVELDRLKLLAVDTLEKELEKDVGYRIAMSGKTPPPDMAAWKQEVAEAMAKWDKGPSTTGVLPLPQTHEQTGRWTQMFLDRQKKAEGTPPRGRPSLVAMLDEVVSPPSPKPAVPGPYSATGMDSSNVPELELKHRFTTDGTKGLKAYFTLNGKELEGVFGWREYLDALARLLKVELRVPYADKRGGAPPFHAMYKGHPVKVVYKAEDLGEALRSTPGERRRAIDLLAEESAKGPLTVTPTAPKTAKRRTLDLVMVNQVIRDLESPKTSFIPKLVVELDGVLQYHTSYHVKPTSAGALWTLYVPDTHPQVGQPDEDILYCGQPAKLRFVYSESKPQTSGLLPASDVVLEVELEALPSPCGVLEELGGLGSAGPPDDLGRKGVCRRQDLPVGPRSEPLEGATVLGQVHQLPQRRMVRSSPCLFQDGESLVYLSKELGVDPVWYPAEGGWHFASMPEAF